MNKLILLIALIAVTRAAFTKEKNVAILTDDNFVDAIKENPNVFVKFYAPWCGHCKSMAPTWEKLGEVEEGVVIGHVDCTVHKNTC